jgi:hypothetical protein
MSYARAFVPTLEDETDGRVGSPAQRSIVVMVF